MNVGRYESLSFESLLITVCRVPDGAKPIELAIGTGFVVESGRGPCLITCRHNLTGREQGTGMCLNDMAALPTHVRIRHNGLAGDDGVDTVVHVLERLYDADGHRLWIEHPELGEAADVVALPLTRLDKVKLMPVEILDAADPLRIRPSEIVSVVGYPFGAEGPGNTAVWASGFIASEFDAAVGPTFYIDCRARKGHSGSPVVAYRTSIAIKESGAIEVVEAEHATSRFLGVYSGRLNQESDLGFVWRATIVRAIVESIQ